MAPKKKSKSGKAKSKTDKAKATGSNAGVTESSKSNTTEQSTIQPGNSNAETTGPEPTLLGIPAELRNRIYRYSLTVSGKRIDVNDPRILKGGPGLLATCRQIRQEASSIFYTENDFYLEACMLDGTKARKFAERMRKYRKDDKVVLPAEICTHPDFYGHGDRLLRKWLKAYYHDPILTPGVRQDTAADQKRNSRTLIVRCFGVVDAMRHKSWAEVADVLEAFYTSIEDSESVREAMLEEADTDWDSEEDSWEPMDLIMSDGPFRMNHDPRRDDTGNDELFGSGLLRG